MDDDIELTTEQYADLQRRMSDWEEAHPDVQPSQFMHPYFAEILEKSLRRALLTPLFDTMHPRPEVN